MKLVTVSAPGKLHISGEHAVVYGNPAIIVSVSHRLYVTLGSVKGKPESSKFHVVRHNDSYIDAIAATFEQRFGKTIDDIPVQIASDIPAGAGMGSSAALAVSLLSALMVYYDLPWDTQHINELAFRAEKFKHATTSGSDTAVATHGGLLWYRKELDFLKIFWLLPMKIPQTFVPFVLINTGRSETTGALVEAVSEMKKRDEDAFVMLLHEIELVTKRIAKAIHDENASGFREAMAQNESYLERMGVVSEKTKSLIREIVRIGGVAKVSGAGGIRSGSGVVIAMHDDPQKIHTLAKKLHLKSFTATLGGEGVRREQVVA